MLTVKRIVLIAIVVAFGAVVAPSVGLADDGWVDTFCHKGQPRPGCDVEAETRGRSGNSQAGVSRGDGKCRNRQGQVIPCQRDGARAAADGCYYEPVELSESTVQAMGGQRASPGGWYMRACYVADATGESVLRVPVWLSTPPVASPEVLARQARSMLTLPDVLIRVSPAGDQLVGLPSWLAVDPASWQTRSATASVPGVSVTATARPVTATWLMGDGNSVVCHGPGTVWRPGWDPAAASPDCGYRYVRSSAGAPGAAFPVTVTISWQVSWAGAGQSGTVPGLTTTGGVRLRVAESQTVITR
ncbi:MAG: hypothetical protein LC708_03110 [Actinobacteria bacterium]|nr:hypothetical protein [Actinomycetota bacterium]